MTSLLAARRADLLLEWSFVGSLQHSVEKLLAFRARNADPLAEPNYSKVLYAFFIRRGDYRSGALQSRKQVTRHGDSLTSF